MQSSSKIRTLGYHSEKRAIGFLKEYKFNKPNLDSPQHHRYSSVFPLMQLAESLIFPFYEPSRSIDLCKGVGGHLRHF